MTLYSNASSATTEQSCNHDLAEWGLLFWVEYNDESTPLMCYDKTYFYDKHGPNFIAEQNLFGHNIILKKQSSIGIFPESIVSYHKNFHVLFIKNRTYHELAT